MLRCLAPFGSCPGVLLPDQSEGERGRWGEFKPGTLNSNPLVYFPHELTPGPWLRMGEWARGRWGEFSLKR